MSTSVCQACLVSDVKMHMIENIQLLEIYEKLTSSTLLDKYSLSNKLCFICFSQLQKCYKFSLMAQNSKQMLKNEFHEVIESQNGRIREELIAKCNINVLDVGSFQSVLAEQTSVAAVTLYESTYRILEPLMNTSYTPKKYHNLKVSRTWFVSINESPLVPGEKETSKEEIIKDKKGSNNPYTTCKKCDINFVNKSLLLEHKKTQKIKTSYICHICNAVFTQSKSLNVHMRIHTKEKPYTCVTCQKTFSDGSSLRKHKKTHTGEKPFECDICHTKFTSKSSVVTHMRVHARDKAYACNKCNKAFYVKYALQIHMRNHTGENPYVCDTCNKTFKSKNSIQKHVLIHMEVKPSFPCIQCDRKFTRKSNLTRHAILVHSEQRPFYCKTCNVAFKTMNEFKMHQPIHNVSYSCKICNLVFKKAVLLKGHRLIHSGEIFDCKKCNKTFSNKCKLAIHMRSHTGEKPYVCNICHSRFRQNSHLKKHMDSIHLVKTTQQQTLNHPV